MSIGNIIAISAAAINLVGLLVIILKVWISQRVTVELNKHITNHLSTKLDVLTESFENLREVVVALTTWRESITERVRRIEEHENGGPTIVP